MTKEVRNNIYVHISNIDELKYRLTYAQFEQLRANLAGIASDFQILKYNTSDYSFSTICSPDWDTANEPIVGDSKHYNRNGMFLSSRKGGTQVYHKKWQFVASNYTGFNIKAAFDRTALLQRKLNLVQLKNKIGNLVFWRELLVQNSISL